MCEPIAVLISKLLRWKQTHEENVQILCSASGHILKAVLELNFRKVYIMSSISPFKLSCHPEHKLMDPPFDICKIRAQRKVPRDILAQLLLLHHCVKRNMALFL